jgi:hypothetical protein
VKHEVDDDGDGDVSDHSSIYEYGEETLNSSRSSQNFTDEGKLHDQGDA